MATMGLRKLASATEPDGALDYTALSGERLQFGVGGVAPFDDLPYT